MKLRTWPGKTKDAITIFIIVEFTGLAAGIVGWYFGAHIASPALNMDIMDGIWIGLLSAVPANIVLCTMALYYHFTE